MQSKRWPPKVAKAIDEAVIFLSVLNGLKEKFPPEDVWDEAEIGHLHHRDGSEWAMSARLVYAQIQGEIENHTTVLPRATKYIDLCIRDETLIAQSSSRVLIKVDYQAPGSLEKIEKFIADHLDGTRKWR